MANESRHISDIWPSIPPWFGPSQGDHHQNNKMFRTVAQRVALVSVPLAVGHFYTSSSPSSSNYALLNSSSTNATRGVFAALRSSENLAMCDAVDPEKFGTKGEGEEWQRVYQSRIGGRIRRRRVNYIQIRRWREVSRYGACGGCFGVFVRNTVFFVRFLFSLFFICSIFWPFVTFFRTYYFSRGSRWCRHVGAGGQGLQNPQGERLRYRAVQLKRKGKPKVDGNVGFRALLRKRRYFT